MIKDITKYIYNTNKESFIIHCMILLTGFIVMGILLNNISFFYNNQKQSIDRLDTKKEYQLTNTIEEIQNFTEYFVEDAHLENLKLFYNALNNNNRFIYLDKFEQCMYMENHIGTNIFACGYEDGNPQYYEEEDGTIKYAIKNVTIGKNCQDYYNFKALEGRLFEEDDFRLNSTIPVILGAAYKEFYNIGDIFVGEYLNQQKEYEVIGFLKDDTAITIQGRVIFLDRYVISPSIVIDSNPTTEDEIFYQAASYVEKIEGNVVLTEDYDVAEFTAFIEQLTNKYSMFDIQVINRNASLQNISLIMSCYMGKDMFLLLSGSVFLILTVINWCFSINLFKKISNYFGVQIINGGSEKVIFIATITSVFICILLGVIGSICILIYNRWFTPIVLIGAVVYIAFNMTLNAAILRKILNKDIDYLLRSE